MVKKILIVHLSPMWYRMPLFKEIAKEKSYNIKYMLSDKIFQKYHFDDEDQAMQGTMDYIKSNLDVVFIPNSSFSLIKKLWVEDYDYVIGSGWDSFSYIFELPFFPIICFLRKKKWIVYNNIRWRGQKKRRIIKIIDFFVSILLKSSHSVIVGNDRAKVYIKSLGVPQNKIVKFYNVSEVYFKQENIDEKIRKVMSKNKLNILFIGRTDIEFKGIKYLIEAFKKLRSKRKDVSLILVGSPKEDFNDEEGIYFIKGMPPNNIGYFYKNSDFLVLPSIETKKGNIEGWGLVVNEAYQYGLPVIVTDKVGCYPDIVKDKVNGFVVKEQNSDQLSDRMGVLCANDKLRKKIGSVNRKFFESRLTYKIIGKEWIDYLKSLD